MSVSEGDALFASKAKVSSKRGLGRHPEGILTLIDGRLRFDDDKKGVTLDVPVAEVTDIEQPGWMLGAGFRCDVQGTRYNFGFYDVSSVKVHPSLGAAGSLGTTAASFGELGSARDLCSAWLALIRPQ